jgi:threonine aldolase
MDPAAIADAVRGQNIHFPPTTLLALENTHNRCGGTVLTAEDTASMARVARDRGIPVHLDGARICNASVYLGVPAAELTRDADSVAFCLSKGLSAPIGSLLCGTQEFVRSARKWRKMLGGGMRQVGIVAAAGIVALETMVERLAEDHETALRLARGLVSVPGVVADPARVQTNIVMMEWTGGPAPDFMRRLEERGVRSSYVGGPRIRMVTHHGIEPSDIDEAMGVIGSVARESLGAKE